MSIGILVIITALALVLLSGNSGGGSAGGPAKPAGVPAEVWRWRDEVNTIAAEIGLPYSTAWTLAQIWQESAGDPGATPPPSQDAGEVGLLQVTQTALDDVNQQHPERGLPSNVDSLEGDPEQQLRAGMLYDLINYNRAEERGNPNPTEAAIRSHVEGPPPNTSASDNYWESVQSNHQTLTS